MMRRCILEFSRSRSLDLITRQRRYFSLSRKGSANAPPTPRQNASPMPPEKPPSHAGKVIFGGVLIGAAAAAAYKTGYFNEPSVKKESSDFIDDAAINNVVNTVEDLREKVITDSTELNNNVEENAHVLDSGKVEDERVGGVSDVMPKEETISGQQKDSPSSPEGSIVSDVQKGGVETLSEDIVEKKEGGYGLTLATSGTEKTEANTDALSPQKLEKNVISNDTGIEETSAHHVTSEDIPEASLVKDAKPPNSLLDEYFLPQKDVGSNGTSLKVEGGDCSSSHSKEKEDAASVSEELKDAYISKDGRLVLDFLQAIHAAEERQAEVDARILAEEKKILKEKYEKELRDARARELMYAEEAATLDKELNKERTKAAATVKLLQEKAEEKIKMELERKDNETELQLSKVKELAKAELAAAIASEKASQIEKMVEANLNINALCLAFYARSEEARQTHYVHKLALGALALEDALSKGLPIQTEITALHTYLKGIDKESLLDLVFSSLPEETLNSGTDTQSELNQKFDALKGPLRHFSLIPPGGGGILAHTLSHLASWLKVREGDISGDGIESIITRVENFLAEGKLAEAADVLEGGVRGSQAEEIIGEWVRQARSRAITEQALSLIQSYAIAISVT